MGPNSWPARFKAYTDAIAAHNAITGGSTMFGFYEGGHELIVPGSVANWNQKSRDIIYHPNWYILEQDLYALAQQSGVQRACWFCYSLVWYNGQYQWAFWKHPHQESGRGDGSDGKFDNRLCMATPGYPGSKATTTNQDAHCVSPRGLAFRDWNVPARAPRRRPPKLPFGSQNSLSGAAYRLARATGLAQPAGWPAWPSRPLPPDQSRDNGNS